MKYQINFLNKLAAVVFVMALFSASVFAQNNKEKERIAKSQETKAAFIETNDKMANFFNNAYGYAIFPSIGKGAVGIGGAHGNGVLYKGGAPQMRASMSQVTVGFQWGGQAYSEVVFFEDQRAYDNFVSGKLKLAAQASAVAVTAGASFDVKYNDGVAIFTMVKGGLMYEASVGGQKFDANKWKN
jgi:lipid-binding SYLF domain-containing protein